jgi:DNA-binding transcriptional MocR family regulator
VPFGAGYLAPELLPIATLNRMLATGARELRTAGATYDLPPGLPTLRRQLARRAVSWGLTLRPDEFVTTIGAMEALHLALRAVAKSGDTVAVESPTYFGVLQLIQELGIRAIEIPTHPRAGMDLDFLDDVLRRTSIRAVLAMPTMSSPLGAVMSEEGKERLVRLIDRHDVPLIEDDVYGELVYDGTRPTPAKAFDTAGRVLLCGSVSKTLAPGYRVGWIVPGRYQQTVERLKFSQTVASPTLPQMAVAEFLGSGGYDRHLRRLRRQLAGQVERMRESIASGFPDGTRVSVPRGGFVLWLDLPPPVDAFTLQARALERGIAIAPGPIFSARGRFTSCIRIACGFPLSPRIENALRVLGELTAAQVRPVARPSRAPGSAATVATVAAAVEP